MIEIKDFTLASKNRRGVGGRAPVPYTTSAHDE